MISSYGELIKQSLNDSEKFNTSLELAKALKITAPFISDIQRNKRLPSLKVQKRIKELLSNSKYPPELFDDLAAISNDDDRIVATDLAKKINNSQKTRNLIRLIDNLNYKESDIQRIIDEIGGTQNV